MHLTLQKLSAILFKLSTVLFSSAFAATMPAAQDYGEIQEIGQIGSWELLKDDQACWMFSTATFANDVNVVLEEQILYITFFNGLPEPEISFFVPDCCQSAAFGKTHSDVTPLIWHANRIYSYYQNADEDFLMNLLDSSSVALVSKEFDKKLLSFSLSGIRKAYSEMARSCDFRPVRMLSDEDNVYKG